MKTHANATGARRACLAERNVTSDRCNLSARGLVRILAWTLAVAIPVDAATAADSTAVAGSADETGEPVVKIEEVVISAQKRTENLQDVPISAQVVSSQLLSQENFNSLTELTQTVPAVHISSGTYSNSLFIRGIGSDVSNPSVEQAVATFVDDVYIGRSRMTSAAFLDLDRIEILKGPQSTYFGNNAVAGALNIVTKKPDGNFEAWGRALYGMHDQYAGEGAVGGPITDSLAIRVAAEADGTGGWIKNINDGKYAPIENNKAGRLTLVFTPGDHLDATLKLEGSRNEAAGVAAGDQPYQSNFCPPPAPYPPSFAGNCALALAAGAPIAIDRNYNDAQSGQGSTLSDSTAVLTVNYHLPGHTVTSVSSFYDYHFVMNLGNGDTPAYTLTNQTPESYHQASQELRIASATDGAVDYLLGVYFQNDRLHSSVAANIPSIDFLVSLPPFAPLAPYAPFSLDPDMIERDHVYSIFGSLGWHVTKSLKLNVGLRNSWVNKDFTRTLSYGTATQTYGGAVALPVALQPLLTPIYGVPGTTNTQIPEHALMPSAAIQWQLNARTMAYLSYSRGFKAGGFNGIGDQALPSTRLAFGPEHVNAYELGLKSTWIDNRLLLDLAIFRSDYSDLQVQATRYIPAINNYSQEITNAAQSRSQGVELEAKWAVTRGLRLSADITYLESYYVRFPDALPSSLQSFCGGLTQAQYAATAQCARFAFPVQTNFRDASGEPTSYAPRWSGDITVQYGAPVGGGYRLTTALSPYFTSRYNPDPDGIYPSLGNYVRLDGRVTLEPPGGHWVLDIIGKNLTNRLILTSRNTKEEPWNVAGQLRFQF
jgi:iron complex outermembrane recepter protein